MKKDGFDEMMRMALDKKANTITPSPFLLQRVKNQASTQVREENHMMKSFFAKKLVILGAICALSVTCYAAVKTMSSFVSVSSNGQTYEDMMDENEKLDMNAKFVKAFANGFTFENGGIGYGDLMDENGNEIGEKTDLLTLTYKNQEKQRVSLNVQEASALDNTADLLKEGYDKQTYHFMTSEQNATSLDTEGTEEKIHQFEFSDEETASEIEVTTKSAVELGEGKVIEGTGTGEAKTQEAEIYVWMDGGLVYTLLAMDCDLGEAALVAMADEIMAQ